MYNSLAKMKESQNVSIKIAGSKSISNRAILIAALSQGSSVIRNLPNIQDVSIMVKALQSLSIPIKLNKRKQYIKIAGCNGILPKKNNNIFCKNSGTLTRFVIPVCATQNEKSYYIYASKQMTKRPIKELLLALEKLNMSAEYTNEKYKLPVHIKARNLYHNIIKINDKKSSQFLSGLLIASPYIKGGLSIKSQYKNDKSYVQMTIKIMKIFGVNVRKNKNTYIVRSEQYYKSNQYTVEPDISTASYFWALAAITNSTVQIQGATTKSIQGDIKFLNILKKMGCTINEKKGGISVTGNTKLKGILVNMKDLSDTFMTVAVIACFAQSHSYITGVFHTKFQESNRIFAITQGLKKLGIFVKSDQDSIYISPKNSVLCSGVVNSFNDHRIAMSLALIGLKHENIIVENVECVKKTCPDYFEKMNKITTHGGEYQNNVFLKI